MWKPKILTTICLLALISSAASAARISRALLEPSAWIPSDDPRILSLAKKITAGTNSELEKSRRIHEWVAKNHDYDNDVFDGKKPIGPANDPIHVLETKLGTCGGFSALSVALHRAAGIPARVIQGIGGEESFVRSQGSSCVGKQTNHYWMEAFVGNRWIVIDPSWDARNLNGGRITYFDQNPAEFQKSHLRCHEVEY